jgi:hypothetical protein
MGISVSPASPLSLTTLGLLLVGCGADSSKADEASQSDPEESDTPAQEPVPAVPSSGAATPGEPAGSTGAPEPQEAAFTYAECDPAEKVGSFVVDLAPDHEGSPQFTSITGSVTDGVVPTSVPEVVAEAGDCSLVVSPRFECDAACTALQTCGPDGCVDFPEQHSVGDVTISGLAVPMVMSPTGRNSYSNPTSAMLPHPGFEPGATLVLSAAGDEYSGFELSGWGVSPLSVPAALPEVRRDLPTEIRWTAPESVGVARVYLALNIDNHGASAARIECLTDDDGELDIDAGLTSQLLDRGLSGFPSLTLHRRTVDQTTIEPGCVEFVVGSELVIDVDVEGLTTCSTNDDCPSDQTCQPNLSCG